MIHYEHQHTNLNVHVASNGTRVLGQGLVWVPGQMSDCVGYYVKGQFGYRSKVTMSVRSVLILGQGSFWILGQMFRYMPNGK